MTQLTEKDNGQTLELNVGDTITVRLSENPTTGYRWAVVDAKGLEQVQSTFEKGKAVGAGGFRMFQFRASQPGSHAICLKHWREWEGEISALTQFEARIIVK